MQHVSLFSIVSLWTRKFSSTVFLCDEFRSNLLLAQSDDDEKLLTYAIPYDIAMDDHKNSSTLMIDFYFYYL